MERPECREIKVLTAKYQLGLATRSRSIRPTWWKISIKMFPSSTAPLPGSPLHSCENIDRPFPGPQAKRVAYIGFGFRMTIISVTGCRDDFHANTYFFDYGLDSVKAAAAFEFLRDRYDMIVIGLHNINRYPAHDFGISGPALQLLKNLDHQPASVTFVFGNPYALKYVCDASTLLNVMTITKLHSPLQQIGWAGNFARGRLPVSVCEGFKAGFGICFSRGPLPEVPCHFPGI